MHKFEKRVLLPEDLNPIKSIKEYKEIGGLKGLQKARSMSAQELIDLVKSANLRGRGGAGFPMAIKWQTVKDDPCPIKYVVCNFAEGEPGTYKDRYLISKNPYWVFEGMLIASHVVGAKQTIIGTKEKFKNVVKILEDVIAEYEVEGVCEKGFIQLVQGPDSYLFGEEKALIEVIDGNGAMPRNIPPFIKGVNAIPPNLNPTVVNNVESMSRLPQTVTNGADWFKSMGTEDTPGTVILSLSGDLKTPGMYEVEPGLTVREMLFELGGGPIGDKPIKAVFSGVANRVLTPDQFDLVVDFGTLRADGVGLGSGGFMVYDESRCMVDVARMFSQFLAYSSCGQCLPCNQGLRIITEYLTKLVDYEGSQADIDAINVEFGRCTNQTRCFLPVQESVLIKSIIEKFPQDFENHIKKNCLLRTDLQILKLMNFDDATGQFTIEENPIEFRESTMTLSS